MKKYLLTIFLPLLGLMMMPTGVDAAISCSTSGVYPNQTASCSYSDAQAADFQCTQKVGIEVCPEGAFYLGYPSCTDTSDIESSRTALSCKAEENEYFNCQKNACECFDGFEKDGNKCVQSQTSVILGTDKVQKTTSDFAINIETAESRKLLFSDAGLAVQGVADSTALQVLKGDVVFNENAQVKDTLRIENLVCLNGKCINSWPNSGGSGDSDWTSVSNHLKANVSGNVGIGVTDNPTEKLHVLGNVLVAGDATGGVGSIPDGYLEFSESFDNAGGVTANKILLRNFGGRATGFGVSTEDLDFLSSGNMRFYVDHTDEATQGLEALTILGDGNIGVSKAAPEYTFDVEGTVNADVFRVGGAEGLLFNKTVDNSAQILNYFGSFGDYTNRSAEINESGDLYIQNDLEVDGSFCLNDFCTEAWPTDIVSADDIGVVYDADGNGTGALAIFRGATPAMVVTEQDSWFAFGASVGLTGPSAFMHGEVEAMEGTSMWRMGDTNTVGIGYVDLMDIAGVDEEFSPQLSLNSLGEDQYVRIVGNLQAGEDFGTEPIFAMSASSGGGVVNTRPLFVWQNESSPMMLLNKDGYLGVAEQSEPLYPIHVGFDGTNGNGAHVTTGGTWTNGSSRTFKDRLVALDEDEVFEKVLNLKIQGWYYKDTDEYHIGPFAEDFYEAFQTGLSNEYLAPSDLAAVAVMSVQALDKKYNALEERVEQNEQAIEELRGLVRDLQFQIAQ